MKLNEVDSISFEKVVLESDKPVLCKFTADWCPPCKQLEPVLEKVADEMEGKVVLVKLNIDDAPEISIEYGVRSIPTIIVFKNGQEEIRLAGMQNKVAILDFLKAYR